jgi:hypothetical protein
LTKRCNDYWKEALELFGATSGDSLKQFTYGFLCGQAEKVKAGACHASMSAPLHKDADWVREAVAAIAKKYGLFSYEYLRRNRTQFWFIREQAIAEAIENVINSNVDRAILCGIAEIDPEYALEAPL